MVLAALGLAFLFHGALLVSGSYKRTYDAYVHIFFADHYARHWFDSWEYRWYTGFTVTSYPPGAQQSIALLSKFVGLLDGFIIVQLLAILLLIAGVFRFSRLWVSEEAAGLAALLTVFSSSIAETVHVFGQLPTIFALGFLLNALPSLSAWLTTGRWRCLIGTLIGFAATTAGHHVTTLFGSLFFAGPVIAESLLRAHRASSLGPQGAVPFGIRTLRARVIDHLRRVAPETARAALFGIGLAAVLLIVVLPYWLWSASDPINQITIPHASRDSYIANPTAGLVFWLAPWGVGLVVLPYAIAKGVPSRRWPLAASLIVLTLLGTGGTTPLPKILLGPAYSILTLDRFTFWATIAILPFAGEFIVSLRRGGIARFLQFQFGRRIWRGTEAALAIAFLTFTILIANMTTIRQFQPAAIDMQPIVTFLGKDQHWRWRYLTLGFGDQMAWLAAQTTALTVDGDYHSARRLPELTTTPIERLEGAKYSGVPGIGSLQQIVAVPEKYNLKYIFSNDEFYDPLLFFSGWQRVGRLDNGIMVWQREDIPPLPEALPRKEIPPYQRAMWGIVPMAAVFLAILSLTSPLWSPSFLAFLVWLKPSWRPKRPVWTERLGEMWALARARVGRWTALNASQREPRERSPSRRWWRRAPTLQATMRPSRTLRVAALVSLLAAASVSGVLAIERSPASPSGVVRAYFDDLAFRRFDSAYSRLDPRTRPTYEQYVVNLSVSGGLLASYSELDAVATHVTHQERDYAIVNTNLRWITSLSSHASTQNLTLVRRGKTWCIEPETTPEVVPPDEFFSQPSVNYDQLGQRAISSDPKDPADILDRPDLAVLSARMVRANGITSVVGEVMNVDVDPADLTVTALVFDGDGSVLTEYNAQTVAIHALLPKETTPFRIDFEGVAGTFAGGVREGIEFQPGQRFPVDQSIWDHAASFQVYAKAVVSGTNLDRGVSAQNLVVASQPDGLLHLTGKLFNAGTTEAVIPHLLLTYYDAARRVAWVDEVFLDNAIRPERSLSFDIPLTNARDVSTVFPSGEVFANSLESNVSIDSAWSDPIALPTANGFGSVRLSVNYLASDGSD